MGASGWFRNAGRAAEVAEVDGTSASERVFATAPNPGARVVRPGAWAAAGGGGWGDASCQRADVAERWQMRGV